MAEYIDKRLGDYRIIEEIGSGGMGKVFLAENVHHRKQYALKVLPDELSSDGNFRRRFFDEARVMSELDHPNIVRVHHMGEHDGVYYLVMDYVTGPEGTPRSLRDELKENPEERIEPQKAHKWITQIAEGLSYAHKRGVIHRDIKPGNILVTAEAQVKITDFGLAKAIGSEFILSQIHQSLSLGEQPTIVGEKRQREQIKDTLDIAKTIKAMPTPRRKSTGSTGILGTYDYMSPEQREGGIVDERSDIYSLGVMIYRMLTGRRPVGIAKPPSRVLSGLCADWDKVVDVCLEDKPSERYANMEAMLSELCGLVVASGLSQEQSVSVERAGITQIRPDYKLVAARIRAWLENRNADWPEDEWKDFVISLYDDGSAIGMPHSKLEKIREREKKAWIKAEETHKAEEARIAEAQGAGGAGVLVASPDHKGALTVLNELEDKRRQAQIPTWTLFSVSYYSRVRLLIALLLVPLLTLTLISAIVPHQFAFLGYPYSHCFAEDGEKICWSLSLVALITTTLFLRAPVWRKR